MIIASQHTWKDSEYRPRHDWTGDTVVQWGARGIVLGRNPYNTAFFEAFPDRKVTAGGGFIRGEGATIEEAEDKAYARFVKQNACSHLWGREHYRNTGQLCRHCRAFRCNEIREVVVLGKHRKPLEWHEVSALEMDCDDSWLRIMRLRARVFGVRSRPAQATAVDAFIAGFTSGRSQEASFDETVMKDSSDR